MSISKTLVFTLMLTGAFSLSSRASLAADGNMIVYKNEYCGCCGSWSKALEQLGYKVDTKNIDDLDWAKKQFSVPEEMESCHTAVIEGYVVEGHVNPAALAKLLKERPDVKGIAVPGMPDGALGMDYDADARYTVYAFGGTAGKAPVPYFEVGKD